MTGAAHSDHTPQGAPKTSTRDKIIDAMMRLASRRDFADVTISDIAREADVGIADFRETFPSKGAVLGAFMKRIDREVLTNLPKDYGSEPARDRLYDVLRRRLEALRPHRHALSSIKHWLMRDPLAASALNREMLNSNRFMLEAADIDCEGTIGAVKLQGLTLAFARVEAMFVDDGDLDRALATLDRELGVGEKLVDQAEDLARLARPLTNFAERLFERGRRHRHSGRHSHRRHPSDDPFAEKDMHAHATHSHEHRQHSHDRHPHGGA